MSREVTQERYDTIKRFGATQAELGDLTVIEKPEAPVSENTEAPVVAPEEELEVENLDSTSEETSPVVEESESYTMTVDGEEVSVTLDELLRNNQTMAAANKRFREAAEKAAEAEAKLEEAKAVSEAMNAIVEHSTPAQSDDLFSTESDEDSALARKVSELEKKEAERIALREKQAAETESIESFKQDQGRALAVVDTWLQDTGREAKQGAVVEMQAAVRAISPDDATYKANMTNPSVLIETYKNLYSKTPSKAKDSVANPPAPTTPSGKSEPIKSKVKKLKEEKKALVEKLNDMPVRQRQVAGVRIHKLTKLIKKEGG